MSEKFELYSNSSYIEINKSKCSASPVVVSSIIPMHLTNGEKSLNANSVARLQPLIIISDLIRM